MSLDKTGLITYQAECDNCGVCDYMTDEDDFFMALEEIISQGWTVKKIKGDWEHWCPKCSTRGENE